MFIFGIDAIYRCVAAPHARRFMHHQFMQNNSTTTVQRTASRGAISARA